MSYTKERLQKIYKSLPDALKEALGSVEIQDEIDQICRDNDVANAELIDTIYNLTMDVFMGLVRPDDFEQEINQKLQAQPDAAREIAHRIRRFVLFPLKAEIALLHSMKQAPAQPQAAEQAERQGEYTVEPEEGEEQEKPIFTEEQGKRDTYRETIE